MATESEFLKLQLEPVWIALSRVSEDGVRLVRMDLESTEWREAVKWVGEDRSRHWQN